MISSVLKLMEELVRQGSIPWMLVGSIALFILFCIKLKASILSVNLNNRNEGLMNYIKTNIYKVSAQETIWAIGTESIAGVLPA